MENQVIQLLKAFMFNDTTTCRNDFIVHLTSFNRNFCFNRSKSSFSRFFEDFCVLDVVYNPILTRLCFEAQEADIKRVIGLEMLIAQAKYKSYRLSRKILFQAFLQAFYQLLFYQHLAYQLIRCYNDLSTSPF